MINVRILTLNLIKLSLTRLYIGLLNPGSPLERIWDSQVFYVGSLIFELSIYFIYATVGLDFKGWKLKKPVIEFNEVILYSLRHKENEIYVPKM